MKILSRIIPVAFAVLFVAVEPATAQISSALAKKCRALMVKAHPTELYSSTGSAASQRAYFQKCVSQQGQAPAGTHGSTTGQGN